MPRVDLGSVGAVLSPAEDGFVDTAVELERLGFTTIWLTGGPLSELSQVTAVVRATGTARIATGIIAVDRFLPRTWPPSMSSSSGSNPVVSSSASAVRTVRMRSPRSTPTSTAWTGFPGIAA
jgi:hypothetical protein